MAAGQQPREGSQGQQDRPGRRKRRRRGAAEADQQQQEEGQEGEEEEGESMDDEGLGLVTELLPVLLEVGRQAEGREDEAGVSEDAC